MNILFFPQIANRSYSTGKWFLLKDGHIRMVKNQILAINKYSKDSNFIICVPPPSERMQENSFLYDIPEEMRKQIIIYNFSFSKNVTLNRFHFDMNSLINDAFDRYSMITVLTTSMVKIEREARSQAICFQRCLLLMMNHPYCKR